MAPGTVVTLMSATGRSSRTDEEIEADNYGQSRCDSCDGACDEARNSFWSTLRFFDIFGALRVDRRLQNRRQASSTESDRDGNILRRVNSAEVIEACTMPKHGKSDTPDPYLG